MLAKYLGLENLEQFLGRSKKYLEAPAKQTICATGKNTDIKERYEILFMTQRERAGHKTS